MRKACLLVAAAGVLISLMQAATATTFMASVPWLSAACFAGAWFLCSLSK